MLPRRSWLWFAHARQWHSSTASDILASKTTVSVGVEKMAIYRTTGMANPTNAMGLLTALEKLGPISFTVLWEVRFQYLLPNIFCMNWVEVALIKEIS